MLKMLANKLLSLQFLFWEHTGGHEGGSRTLFVKLRRFEASRTSAIDSSADIKGGSLLPISSNIFRSFLSVFSLIFSSPSFPAASLSAASFPALPFSTTTCPQSQLL